MRPEFDTQLYQKGEGVSHGFLKWCFVFWPATGEGIGKGRLVKFPYSDFNVRLSRRNGCRGCRIEMIKFFGRTEFNLTYSTRKKQSCCWCSIMRHLGVFIFEVSVARYSKVFQHPLSRLIDLSPSQFPHWQGGVVIGLKVVPFSELVKYSAWQMAGALAQLPFRDLRASACQGL